MESVECEVWSVKCGVWSVKCGVWSVKCGVECGVVELWSCGVVECKVWSVERGQVWTSVEKCGQVRTSVEWRVWSVKCKCKMWSVMCNVYSVECKVRSVECEV